MISIQDILSSNLLDNVWAITGFDIFVTLLLAFIMGMFVMIVYGRIYQGAMYSGSFAVSLVALTMISTTLILAVTSNLVLSLGMMGALSIVRFRTAIKDPLEIVFLFWAIETGIVLATGIFPLAVCVNIFIGIILVVLVVRRPGDPYILVLKCTRTALPEVEIILKEYTNFSVKSRKIDSSVRAFAGKSETSTQSLQENQDDDGQKNEQANERVKTELQDYELELDIEVTVKNKKSTSAFQETSFVDRLSSIAGVSSAILVTYNGGYMS